MLRVVLLVHLCVTLLAASAEEEAATCAGIVPMRERYDRVSITDFGGVGDGNTVNTDAFREAIYRIQRLRRRGGTLLYVPPGVYLTASFNLTSHMTLYLANGAVIKAIQVNLSALSLFHLLDIELTGTLASPLNMPSSLDPEAGMSDPEDVQNVLEISSQQSYQGLPSFILETMSDYSVPSPRMLSDELRAYEDEFQEELALLSESPGSARAARLQAIANKQKTRIEEAELDIAAYNQHQTVAENTNGALADRIAGITTAHVLVCLERDGLRRFRMIAIYVIIVLVMLLLGFVVYVHRILHP